MELPKRIYLVQPYPDTADAEWCEDPALYGVSKSDAVLYVRAEQPCNTQMHMDSLNIEHKSDCEIMQTGAPVCTCGAENGCQ